MSDLTAYDEVVIQSSSGQNATVTNNRLDVNSLSSLQDNSLATFSVSAEDVVTGNNKSMFSIVNTGSGSFKIKIRNIKIINALNTASTGVVSKFELKRITSHTSGTSLTPQTFDTADSIGAVTCITGSTVSGEATLSLLHWEWSNDEWGAGSSDVESFDHTMQTLVAAYQHDTSSGCKPLTLRVGEGFTLKHIINSTVGVFDIYVQFTQEN